jgi:hypothetical protein
MADDPTILMQMAALNEAVGLWLVKHGHVRKQGYRPEWRARLDPNSNQGIFECVLVPVPGPPDKA